MIKHIAVDVCRARLLQVKVNSMNGQAEMRLSFDERKKIRLAVVDDHALVRDAVSGRLAREPDMQIVGLAGDAEQGIDVVKKHKPDVVLMDIDMPGLYCFEAAQTMRMIHPTVRLIFFTGYVRDRHVHEALAVRAAGFVTKYEASHVVVTAIRSVMVGKPFYSAEIRDLLLIDEQGVRPAVANPANRYPLTKREMQVLRYLSRGLSKKTIAQTMHLSVKTIDNHSTRLMNKLKIHDRVSLARFAIREGLADP